MVASQPGRTVADIHMLPVEPNVWSVWRSPAS